MKTIFLLSTTLFIFSCASMKGLPVNIDNENMKINSQLEASTGDIFFQKEKLTGEDNHFGSVYYGDAYKFQLELTSITKDSLTLSYSEYMKPVASAGGYKLNEGWLMKPLFNKQITYPAKPKDIITYRDYKFEIIKNEANKITYKRIN